METELTVDNDTLPSQQMERPATFRLVRLWKNARAISDWLTLSVSSVCCPCCETMSLSGSSCSETSEKSAGNQSQLVSSPVIDAGRGTGEPFQPHHVVIDFSPRPEDTDEVQERCIEFLKLVNNSPNLREACSSRAHDMIPEETSLSSSKSKEKFIANDNAQDFPAIHAVKKLSARGAVKAAFETNLVRS